MVGVGRLAAIRSWRCSGVRARPWQPHCWEVTSVTLASASASRLLSTDGALGGSGSQEEPEVRMLLVEVRSLMASATADVSKLGGAVAARLRQSGSAVIGAVGPQAAYRSIKAVVSATEYLRQDEGAPRDQSLAMRLSERPVPQKLDDGGGFRRTVMTFEVEPHQVSEVPRPVTRDIIVGAQTNAGKAAAAVAGIMKQDKTATARTKAMGAAAIHQALVAHSLAQEYLNKDGHGVKFVILPQFEDMEGNSQKPGKPVKQLVLKAVRIEV